MPVVLYIVISSGACAHSMCSTVGDSLRSKGEPLDPPVTLDLDGVRCDAPDRVAARQNGTFEIARATRRREICHLAIDTHAESLGGSALILWRVLGRSCSTGRGEAQICELRHVAAG